MGLPEGQMGNSEVGHLNLGAGAVVKQDLTRIGDAGLSPRTRCCWRPCATPSGCTCSGLVSHGGVHASMDHLQDLLELARAQDVSDVVVHAFTDGRDTAPDSGAGYLAELEGWLAEPAAGWAA